ncbi:MAG: class I SAM-dependent methyltransferase [Anaerolineales bacterium]
MDAPTLLAALQTALHARAASPATDPTPLRLFNGFTEGFPPLSVERYAHTLVLLNNAQPPQALHPHLPAITDFYLNALPGLTCILLKDRRAPDPEARRGRILFGGPPATQVTENGVTYALDLTLNQDTSFYLDTRNLRLWAKETLHGKSVLNTFAYTGSLGVAALAGGAARVVQTDLNPRFLDLAKRSTRLNGFPVRPGDFPAANFFAVTARLRHANTLFDCVILDPPYFSTTPKGRVDVLRDYHRLVNKVRPLVAHQGYLVCVNNALFLPGAAFMHSLEQLCADGYLSLEQTLPVPPDCTGPLPAAYPADPAPFNHPTKIVILNVTRKDGKTSTP